MNGMPRLKLRKPAPISLHFSPSKAPFKAFLPSFNNLRDPLHLLHRDAVASRPDGTLTWKVITQTSASALPKAVLRHHLRRRWREAFIAALKQRGYDRNGRLLVGSSTGTPLRGTMELLFMEGYGFHLDFQGLVNHANEMVLAIKQVVEQQGSRKSSPSPNVTAGMC